MILVTTALPLNSTGVVLPRQFEDRFSLVPIFRRVLIAKKQNTFEKRQREMEKKHKAQEKLKRRLRRKNSPAEISPPVPDEADLDLADDEN